MKRNSFDTKRDAARSDAVLSKGDLFDLVVKTAPDAIVTADVNGAILSFSPAAERMFGYAEEEIVGENLTVLMPQPYQAAHDGYMRRYLETGEKRIIGIGREVKARRRDGEIFVAELAIGELHDGEKHVFTGFIRDATDRVEAIDKARRLQRSLGQAARVQLIGEMSTALAHEVNQPLTAIANFARAAARMLEEETTDRAKAAVYVERVAEQAQRAGEIIKRMRRLVDRGRIELKPDDINDIVLEAVRASETGIRNDMVEIRLELAEDLPRVLVDRIQIQQVIINLLRNAQEAVEEGAQADPEVATGLHPPAHRIEMTARPSDKRFILVSVSDTGPGVPEGMQETIFDPLVTTKPHGFGVGLAVCRTIVHAHGGRIWIENNPAGGADVHFTLRIAEETP